jgi:polyisoprenoid-binding protein YceI
MIMNKIILKSILTFFAVLLIAGLKAQVQTYKPSAESFIEVKGTSTLHDWEMRSENIISEVQFKMNEKGHPEDIESLIFRLNKTSLKSKQSSLDRRAYDALNASKHPEIVFRMNGNSSIQENGDKYKVSLNGDLVVAGISRQVNITATCLNGDDKKLVCSGTEKLKMTDFQIDPPVMMLGALKTADEITINYRIVYTR